MLTRLLKSSKRLSNRCFRQRIRLLVDVVKIREQANSLRHLTDSQITSASNDLRDASKNASEVNAFSLATEAVRRTTGRTYYDVQLQAGQVLADGHLAEMQTGEGKTLVTLLPVYDAILKGHNVHVATTNSYLAERDYSELQPAFELLGLKSGLLPENNDDNEKRSAYESDVTYGTGYEFGFDYLRDQLSLRQQPPDVLGESWLRSLNNTVRPAPRLVQSQRQLTIVDEIDSVLIDEANTPLVISFFASDESNAEPYRLAAHAAEQLREGVDYQLDTTERRITISQSGREVIQRHRKPGQLHRPWRIYVEQALRARFLLNRDVDYVVRDGEVALVDQHTGRIFPDRKLRDGLHQAVEFRENAKLTAETNSFARISRQKFFQQYQIGTGMTGTAMDAVREFQDFFSLNVIPIPLNRPSKRTRYPSRFFADCDAKYKAIIDDATKRHRCGQPVLIGARTIEQSRAIAALLSSARLPHHVLNGVQDADEAAVIATAGEAAAITVATNMAGRGTDIKLSEAAREAGGLHVIVAEPHRSHRIDRQLIGRAARQGDPGSCQMFVSCDDQLLLAEGKSLARRIQNSLNRAGEAVVGNEAELDVAQRKAEYTDFLSRQHMMQQDCWVEGVLQTLVGTDN